MALNSFQNCGEITCHALILAAFGSSFPLTSMACRAPKGDQCFVHVPKLSTLGSSTPSPRFWPAEVLGLCHHIFCILSSFQLLRLSPWRLPLGSPHGTVSLSRKSFTCASESTLLDGAKPHRVPWCTGYSGHQSHCQSQLKGPNLPLLPGQAELRTGLCSPLCNLLALLIMRSDRESS